MKGRSFMELAGSLLIAASLMTRKGCSFVVNIPHQSRLTVEPLLAKKKKKGGGGGKKGKQQKKGGFEWASSFTLQPYEAQSLRELATTALASFKGRASKQLSPEMETATDLPKALWNAPVACVIVAPEEESEGSTVKYANIAALETVGLKPNEFEVLFPTGPPKPKAEADEDKNEGTAGEDGEKEESDNDGDDDDGDDDNNKAIRLDLPPIMKGDKKFERGYRKKMLRQESGDISIIDAYRWSLEKSAIVGGKFVTESFGVAYAWPEWLVGENLLCSPGGIQTEVEDLGDIDERIERQGAFIRDLKENQGFTNKDPQVAEAVAELLRLKDLKG